MNHRQILTSKDYMLSKFIQIIHASNRFFYGFLEPGQCAAARLTHYSSKRHDPLTLYNQGNPGEVKPNLGPTNKYPCAVCIRQLNAIIALIGSMLSLPIFKTQRGTEELMNVPVADAVPT